MRAIGVAEPDRRGADGRAVRPRLPDADHLDLIPDPLVVTDVTDPEPAAGEREVFPIAVRCAGDTDGRHDGAVTAHGVDPRAVPRVFDDPQERTS